jgi:hypothetical protein
MRRKKYGILGMHTGPSGLDTQLDMGFQWMI